MLIIFYCFTQVQMNIRNAVAYQKTWSCNKTTKPSGSAPPASPRIPAGFSPLHLYADYTALDDLAAEK